MYSDDEITERITRTLADCHVTMAMTVAAMTVAAEQAAEAFRGLGYVGELMRSEMEREMSPDMRAIYDGLVATGTPWLEAACEAEELI